MWQPTLPTEWTKTFLKGLDRTLHTEAGKMDQAFAALNLILRKWLRIWRRKAIHMKEVATEVFVIVNEKENPQTAIFQKLKKMVRALEMVLQRTVWFRWASRFWRKCHVKGGSFLELFIFNIWPIYWCPPGKSRPLHPTNPLLRGHHWTVQWIPGWFD